MRLLTRCRISFCCVRAQSSRGIARCLIVWLRCPFNRLTGRMSIISQVGRLISIIPIWRLRKKNIDTNFVSLNIHFNFLNEWLWFSVQKLLNFEVRRISKNVSNRVLINTQIYYRTIEIYAKKLQYEAAHGFCTALNRRCSFNEISYWDSWEYTLYWRNCCTATLETWWEFFLSYHDFLSIINGCGRFLTNSNRCFTNQ